MSSPIRNLVHLVCGDKGAKLGEPGVVEAGEQGINTLLLSSSGIARFNPTIALHYIQMASYYTAYAFLITISSYIAQFNHRWAF